jgi:hypothetical protein
VAPCLDVTSPPPEAEIPDTVRRLLIERVDGFEALELLLRLCREPDRRWTVADAQAALGMADMPVHAAFESLLAEDLIGRDDATYWFEPPTPEVRVACEALVRLYDEDRFRIVALMGQLAFERIHHATARAFADAFRIRKAPKRGGDDA